MIPSSTDKNRLTIILVFFSVLVLTFILYRPTVLYLLSIWNDIRIGEYAHGYLVVAISAYLVFDKRRELSGLPFCPDSRGLFLVLLATLFWLASTIVDIEVLQAIALLLLLQGVIWSVFGSAVSRLLLFPVMFISFAIPIWFPLSPILQELTADVTFWSMRLLDVPAMRQENLIILPAGSLSIEEACSGLRYLLAALTLGTLYAYLNYSRLRERFVVVLVTAVAAIVANIVRVSIVVYLGYSTDMRDPLVRHHLMLGWYLFGGVIAALLLIDAIIYRYRQKKMPCQAVSDNEPVFAQQSANLQDTTTAAVKRCTTGRYIPVLVLVVLVTIIGPLLNGMLNHHATSRVLANTESLQLSRLLPDRLNDWVGQSDKDDWVPVYHGALMLKKTYKKQAVKVDLFIAYYPWQTQGREVINETNHISNDAVWRPVYMRTHTRQLKIFPVLEQLLEKENASRKLVWYHYCIAGYCTINKYQAKLLQLLGVLTGNQSAYVVAVSTDITTTPAAARLILNTYIRETNKSLQKKVVEKLHHLTETDQ